MSTGWGRKLQAAAACLLVVGYASLAHFSNAHDKPALGATLALTPVTLVAVAVVWRWSSPLRATLLTLGLVAVLYELFPLFKRNFSLFYLVQESSIYFLLGLTFSRSLMGGRTALCTRLADKLHGPLSPREVLYTRRVTLAWALFFFAVACPVHRLVSRGPSANLVHLHQFLRASPGNDHVHRGIRHSTPRAATGRPGGHSGRRARLFASPH